MHGVNPLRFPSEYFRIPAAVMFHPAVLMENSVLPVNTHSVRPIAPRCTVCDPSLDPANNMTVLVGPLDFDRIQLSSVIRGIANAKASLDAHTDKVCDFGEKIAPRNGHTEQECLHSIFFSKIDVVLLVRKNQTQQLPELLPPFVTVEVSNIVDALARHRYAFAMVSHCGPESDIASYLGVSLLCLPKGGSSRELMRHRNRIIGSYDTSESVRSDDIASGLFSLLLDGVNFRMKISYDLLTADEVMESVYMILSQYGTTEIRKLQEDTAKRKEDTEPSTLDAMALWFYAVLYGVLGLAIFYAHSFLDTVKSPSQIPAWKRRFRHLSRITQELDPFLLDFQQWLKDPQSMHNQLVPPLEEATTTTATTAVATTATATTTSIPLQGNGNGAVPTRDQRRDLLNNNSTNPSNIHNSNTHTNNTSNIRRRKSTRKR